MQGTIQTGKTISLNPLLVDLEIEKTARRKNSDTKGDKLLVQQVVLQSSSSSTLES